MKIVRAMLCLGGTLVPACSMMMAQSDGVFGPPKVLSIQREWLKPGRTGSAHQKTEAAYLAAAKSNKAPFHYLAMTSMSGRDRALFMVGYPSFQAWEDQQKAQDKNPALGAALDHAMLADGDLQTESDTTVAVWNPEQSMGSPSLKGARYMEISVFIVKPGHDAQWDEIVKMVKEAYAKGVPEASWSEFDVMYGTGTSGSQHLVMSMMKSLGEVDQHMMGDAKFAAAMGKDGMKRLDALMADAVQSQQTNLFHIDPKMSLPMDEWVAAEPDYWKPKAAMPMKKAEAGSKQ